MEEVKIEKQDHYGRGIARLNSKIVFVEKSLPGEVCKIELSSIKKNFATGRLTEIITFSNNRVTPFCPYYDLCGGCDLEHQERKSELEFKKSKVEELIQKFAGCQLKIKEIIYGSEKNYRNKVTLHGEDHHLGYYEEKSHKLIPISECLLLKSELNQVIKRLNLYLEKNQNEIIDTAVIRTTTKKEILLSLTGKLDHEKILENFSDITSLYIKNHHVSGRSSIAEEMNGFIFKISPQSFFQVNDEMREKLYQKVISILKEKKIKRLLDLYCGTGTMGILLSNMVEEIVGIDIEPAAIDDAKENAKINNVKNITFLADKVENQIDNFTNIDCIIVDPPRAGLDNKTKEELKKIKPSYLIYISCDPVTLSRDLKCLLDTFDISESSLVDMFPNTAHIETIVCLEKK